MLWADWVEICAYYKVESYSANFKAKKLTPEQHKEQLDYYLETGKVLE